MSKEDRAVLRRDVNVVMHCAATVRFDNSAIGLSTAVKINVRGLREVMALARGMRRLVSFVHVSSGYVQCHLQGEAIREEIYPPEKHSVQEVLRLCDDLPSEMRAREMIGERPNTCHFTKVRNTVIRK